MALKQYHHKRNFRRTPEPKGSTAKKTKSGWQFVVQKHAATHLHYDFRLELDGVLKSWAVPKGPSLDPSVKRLAMQVEDHPLEYGSFEGTIPAGEYGGGTVMLWDRGTWEPTEDPHVGYRQGKLHFKLNGEKLRGEWVLVRRGGRSAARDERSWLLFKVRDAEARPTSEGDILEQEANSVATGRDMDEIAGGKSKVWNSGKSKKDDKRRTAKHSTAHRQASVRHKTSRAATRKQLTEMAKAKKAPLPAKIAPQLATLVKQAPDGEEWFNEIKFDGYRLICRVDGAKVTLSSRNQLDWTARVPHLVQAVKGLGLASAILDGEVVSLDEDGISSFQSLQNAFSEGRASSLVYYLFDLLYLNGYDLRNEPLEERKRLLAELIENKLGPLRYSEHIVGGAPAFFRESCGMRLEGIICKRRDRPYLGGRGLDWLKVKCSHREEFVIGGFTPPAGARHGFGALLVGYYDDQQHLIYAGKVGTGYSDRVLDELSKRLRQMEQEKSPFDNLQSRTGVARSAHWVQPKLVAQVEFSEWTRDGSLRHPSFLGLREDKRAEEVRHERPLPVSAATKSSNGKKSSASEKSAGAKTKSRAATSNGKPARAAESSSRATKQAEIKIPASVRLTHPERVIYPDLNITKRDLAGYYVQVAKRMLPHLKDRPLVLVRCPDGQAGKCFYQKHARPGMPDVLRRIPVVEKSKTMEYVMADDLEGLLALVQFGALEIHVWGSRADKLELPDRLVFDLDPDLSVPWPRVVESAQQIRAFFAELDLTVFLKTTGGKGLHLVLPIQRRYDWDEIRQITQAIAATIVRQDPDRYTDNMSKAARKGKIYLDYLRNARGATAVAPYSTRARAGAPVSVPITWDELPEIESPAQFTVLNVPERLARQRRDPWAALASTRQSLTKSLLKQLGIALG